jgi:diadenosine tetraphosphate (Ap4A) HIT family hydrolase
VGDDGCLFCDIDHPDHTIIARSEHFYARLDNYPANPGHTEIVPFAHVDSWFHLRQVRKAEAMALLTTVQEWIVETHGQPDGWTWGVNDGKAAGRSVDHLHIHLIPRYHGDVPDPRGGIRRGAPNCNPDEWGAPAAAEPRAAQADLLHRYAEALAALQLHLGDPTIALAAAGHPVRLSGGERDEAARLVLAVRDEELARLRYEVEQWHAAYGPSALPGTLARLRELQDRAERAEAKVAEYENAISWGTDCVAHATLHDKCRRQAERAEKAEAAVARVRRLCELTIAASVRVQAIEQARDTLAALDGETSPGVT